MFSPLLSLILALSGWTVPTCHPTYTFKVIRQEVIQPTTSLADRRLIFEIKNTSDEPIWLYGSRTEDKMLPFRYLLSYDEVSNQWRYPTADGKALEWNRESSIYKQSQLLRSGESIEFWMLMSTFPSEEGGKRLKIAARAGCNVNEEPSEIRSSEFVVK